MSTSGTAVVVVEAASMVPVAWASVIVTPANSGPATAMTRALLISPITVSPSSSTASAISSTAAGFSLSPGRKRILWRDLQ